MARKPSRRASRAWDRLRQWYGARLAEQYGDVPPDDWCALIDRTDDERLAQALERIRDESPVYPPTFGQLEQAIPRKRAHDGGPSVPDQLCRFIAEHRRTCEHQRAKTWAYFGPITEFPPNKTREEPKSTPEPRGVVIPACAECGISSIRVTTKDLTTPGVAA